MKSFIKVFCAVTGIVGVFLLVGIAAILLETRRHRNSCFCPCSCQKLLAAENNSTLHGYSAAETTNNEK